MDKVVAILVMFSAATGLGACRTTCAEITGVADFISPYHQDVAATIWDCDGFRVVDDQPIEADEPFTIEISRAGCYNGLISLYDPRNHCYGGWIMEDTNIECGDSIKIEWQQGPSSCED